MNRYDYDKALKRLVDQYIGSDMRFETYARRYDALQRKFDESQQEKPSDNRTVERAGTDAGD